ncbi:MAG: sugar ABC transporter permease [Bifidobacteriaceae bacterium]|jgi:multiple sugar transport system permease protein|nr:sugar ABC transporter permease [Bifidobacteriaceae bacterium]
MTAAVATAPPARPAAPPKRSRGAFGDRRRRQSVAGLALVAPFLVSFLIFNLWPIIWSLIMAVTDMTNRDLRSPFAVEFKGLANFGQVLSDPQFGKALGVTGILVIGGIPLSLIVGMTLAVLLNTGIQRLRTFFRAAFYVPVVTSLVAIAVVWKFLFAADGLINTLLATVGVDGPTWINEPAPAIAMLLLLIVWRSSGMAMILFLAGLQAIPVELHEAAKVDGATAWRRIRSITIPLMRPTILLVSVLMSVGLVQVFEEPFVLTRGGPLKWTTTAALHIYDLFGFGQYSLAAASSYILFLVIGAMAIIQFRMLRPKV